MWSNLQATHWHPLPQSCSSFCLLLYRVPRSVGVYLYWEKRDDIDVPRTSPQSSTGSSHTAVLDGVLRTRVLMVRSRFQDGRRLDG